MPTDKDRRTVLTEWKRRISQSTRMPLMRRPKREAIIYEICTLYGISRRTLFNWKAKLA